MGNFLKGAKAFTGTLLFGSDESQGLIKTLGSASLEAGKNFSSAMLSETSTKDCNESNSFLYGDLDMTDGWGIGRQGSGYYKDGLLLVPDEDD